AAGLAQHVFSPRNAVDARLEGLRRLVEWASSVTEVGARSGLKTMIEKRKCGQGLVFGIGKPLDRIAHGAPRRCSRLFPNAPRMRARLDGSPLPDGNLVAVPILTPRLVPHEGVL